MIAPLVHQSLMMLILAELDPVPHPMVDRFAEYGVSWSKMNSLPVLRIHTFNFRPDLNVNKGIAFGSPVEGLFDDNGEVGRSSAMT